MATAGMFTQHEYRGRGIAQRIVKEAVRQARREDYPRMTLHDREMGRPIYEKLGWERTWEMKFPLNRRSSHPSKKRSNSRS